MATSSIITRGTLLCAAYGVINDDDGDNADNRKSPRNTRQSRMPLALRLRQSTYCLSGKLLESYYLFYRPKDDTSLSMPGAAAAERINDAYFVWDSI